MRNACCAEVEGKLGWDWGRREDAEPVPDSGRVYKWEEEEVVKGVFGTRVAIVLRAQESSLFYMENYCDLQKTF